MIKTIIIIDGSNFYFKLKSLGIKHQLNFNYSQFVDFLIGNKQLVNSTYYIGKVRTDKTVESQKLHKNQQRLLAHLKKHSIQYKLGYLLRNNSKYHEKGVDVHIAVDILVATYEKLCDKIILVSSDTDLAPAIKKAQEKGKIIEYVGFSHKPSVAMVRFCKESRLLTKNDLLPFINKQTK